MRQNKTIFFFLNPTPFPREQVSILFSDKLQFIMQNIFNEFEILSSDTCINSGTSPPHRFGGERVQSH